MPAHIPFEETNSPLRGVLDLAGFCYPKFLFGGSMDNCLPVFHFHEASPPRLEPYLAHLVKNGYQTVTSEAVARYVLEGRHPGPRSVVLCFDDAWASLWTVAAPLLRRHGLQAIAYVSPGRVVDASDVRPTIDTAPEAVSGDEDQSETPFATWPELRALHASGTIDIQAHSLRHAMVFCDGVCRGFLAPDEKRHVHLYPWLNTARGRRVLMPDDLGAPLYLQRSRYSDALGYSNPSAFEACTQHVRERGGAGFFQRSDWQKELQTLEAGFRGVFESPDERDSAIHEDFASARAILNRKLSISTVRHMCFPWAISGRAAEGLAAETGYQTAFADRLFGTRVVRAGDPPYRLMRLKHEYVFCLPGAPRKSFFIVQRQIRRQQAVM